MQVQPLQNAVNDLDIQNEQLKDEIKQSKENFLRINTPIKSQITWKDSNDDEEDVRIVKVIKRPQQQ